MARILVCEDDGLYRDLASAALAGHEIEMAEDGDQAIGLLRRRTFDLVVTDIIMPGFDGLELISAIRKTNQRIPVLAMSAGIQDLKDPLLTAASVLGATETIEKPFRARDLAARVEALLAASGAEISS